MRRRLASAALLLALTALVTSPAASAAGTAAAWGWNVAYQLGDGDGTTNDRYSPVDVLSGGAPLANVSQVAGGGESSMALLADGSVVTWGDDLYGQLGCNGCGVGPGQVVGPGGTGTLGNITQIAAGFSWSVARRADGTVWAWGFNGHNELGYAGTDSNVPIQSGGVGFGGVALVAAGYSDTYALKSDGTVWAWGDDNNGALGNTTIGAPTSTPVEVMDTGGTGFLQGITGIAAGNYHALAVDSNGHVWGWGYNNDGQVGDGTSANTRTTPVQVVGEGGVGTLSGIQSVVAGDGWSMALGSDGTVWTWGINSSGELGNGVSSGPDRITPGRVVGPGGSGTLQGVVAIGSGSNHALALKSDGSVWAWGQDNKGQLGTGVSGTPVGTPVQVAGFAAAAVGVGTGGLHSLAVRAAPAAPGGSVPMPSAVTAGATAVGDTGATLTGTVNANGTDTTYHFDYGTTAAYGSTTPDASAGALVTDQAVSATVQGLAPATTYHYRLVAQNAGGAATGSDNTFTTSAGRPPAGPPAPVFARSVNAAPISGQVLVQVPGSRRFVPLTAPEQIQLGSVIDARHGRVRITIVDAKGRTWSADFFEGVFKITQLPKDKGVAQMTLVGGSFKRCPAGAAAVVLAAKKPKSVRHLWGSGKGPFRTKGRFASASIRGTTWDTDDRCDGTLVKVTQGSVAVRDLPKKKTVVIKARRQYLAAAPTRRRG